MTIIFTKTVGNNNAGGFFFFIYRKTRSKILETNAALKHGRNVRNTEIAITWIEERGQKSGTQPQSVHNLQSLECPSFLEQCSDLSI